MTLSIGIVAAQLLPSSLLLSSCLGTSLILIMAGGDARLHGPVLRQQQCVPPMVGRLLPGHRHPSGERPRVKVKVKVNVDVKVNIKVNVEDQYH